ncbi:MAG: zinc-ribbon domain-containing protein, partial [Clostridia bacterium]|nr:zinc-ribbon domain-containing protein [Clostridia bacterium]
QPEAPKFGFCPRCGTPLQAGMGFCPKCGTPVGGTAPNGGNIPSNNTPNNGGYTPNNGYTPAPNGGYAPANVTVPTGGAAATMGNVAARTAVAAGKSAKKKVWIIIICALLAVAATTTVLVVFVFGKSVDERIVGTWEGKEYRITFLSDGTGSMYYKPWGLSSGIEFSTKNGRIETKESAFGLTETKAGSYTIEDDTLTFHWDDGTTEVYTKIY